MIKIFDSTRCLLGEGAFWHPNIRQFFWFDIENKKLLTKVENKKKEWLFDYSPSACGWVDDQVLLIAFENNLSTFNIKTSELKNLISLEGDNIITRSNDGRADPWGGFWIGTMGKKAESQSGKIYRFFKGRIFELYSNMTITNSICFSPNKEYAFYTDTVNKKIMRVKLDNDGWPLKDSEIFIDLTKENLNPDGSVIDSSGCLWNAQWGASRVAKYSPEGKFLESIIFPASQVTCPAFGGDDLKTLFVTSASVDLLNSNQNDGVTFAIDLKISGQKEHQIIL